MMKWWRRIFHRRELERRLAQELQSHIDQETDWNIRAGMPEEEARKAALASFGNTTSLKEDVRETWGWTGLEQFRQDLRYASRVLRKSPAFAIVSVMLLGIGIGATSTVFTAVNAVFWNPLPVQDPEELRMISWTSPALPYAGTLTHGTYLRMRDQFHLSDLACSWRLRSSMAEWGPVAFQLVTGNYFRMLGVKPVIGRLFSSEDDTPGAPQIAVISYRLWRRAYGGSPDVLNRELTIGRRSFRIVGVMPEGFAGLWPLEPQDVMLPFTASMLPAPLAPPRDRRMWSCSETVGRLPDGMSDEQIRAEGQALLEEQFAVSPSRYSNDARLLVTGIQQSRGMRLLQEKTLTPLRILLVAAGIILLITCVNIGSLLLARGRARHQELATRLALGAARPRVMRQLLTESLALSIAGGLLGIALAYGATPLLPDMMGELAGRNWLTPAMAPGVHLKPDIRVLGFATLLTISAGILFGVFPAWRATRIDLISLIKQRTGLARQPLGILTGKLLVTVQVSLAMTLLIAASLFGSTLLNLQSTAIGFNPERLLFVETDPSRNAATFVEDTLRTLEAMPGVSAAAVSQWPLYNNAQPKLPVCVPEHQPAENGMDIEPVSPGFFETWGVRFLSGRDFDRIQDAGRGAIVNEKFAKAFFAGRNPLGQRIGLGRCPGGSRTIVGVVEDHRDRQREEITPMVYVPYPFPRMAPTTFAIRTSGDERALLPAIRRLMQENGATVDGDVMTGTSYVAREWRRERLLAGLSAAFGVLALLISCLGIYGMLAYSVTRRTAEIGLRVALGALPGTVVRMVIRESILPVGTGILLGGLAALAAAGWIESILFGISTADPLTLAGVSMLLLVTAVVASLLPATRASRIDPMRALRCE